MTDPSRVRVHLGRLLLGATLLGCGESLPTEPAPPIDPGYQLRVVGGTSHTVALMEVLPLVLLIERAEGGYEGPVTFTADAPPGIVVIFRPTTVLVSDATDILLVAEGSVEPRRHQVTLRGTAPDRPDRLVVIDLDLTPAR